MQANERSLRRPACTKHDSDESAMPLASSGFIRAHNKAASVLFDRVSYRTSLPDSILQEAKHMSYEIVKDGSYFRITWDNKWDDSDPLYMSRSEAQKAVTRYKAGDSERYYQEAKDRAYTFVQGYFE